MTKAIILLSGGLDSATTCAVAKQQGFELCGISFNYGQRHHIELQSAQKIAQSFNISSYKIIDLDLRTFGGSALTADIAVPKNQTIPSVTDNQNNIPITYVPARNTIFLSYALAFSELLNCYDIFIGVNAIDYSGYPDCRKDYINAYEKMANLALASTINNNKKITIHTPLIDLTKAQIIQLGLKLHVDYAITHSCYDPQIINQTTYACGKCDSCQIRLEGFKKAGSVDPIKYFNSW